MKEGGKSDERRVIKGDIVLPGMLKSLFGKNQINGVDLKGEGEGFLQNCQRLSRHEAFLKKKDVSQFVKNEIRDMNLRISTKMAFENRNCLRDILLIPRLSVPFEYHLGRAEVIWKDRGSRCMKV